MTTATYDRGDNRRLSIVFTDFADVESDPDAVTAIITEPDGVANTFVYLSDTELAKDSTGNYHIDYLFTKAGRHQVRFEGVGTITSAEQTDVYIRA